MKGAASAALLALWMAACASAPPPGTGDVPARGLAAPARELPPAAPQPPPPAPSPVGPWTEAEALALAAAHRPELAAATARVAAAGARVRAAGRLPNPLLYALAEAVPLESFPAATEEYLFGLQQQLPIGGRVGRAEEVAERQLEAAAADALALGFELRREVRGAFATALYAARASELAAEANALAREERALAAARLEAGDLTPPELSASELAEARARADARRAAALDERARAALAAAVGLPGREVAAVAGDLSLALELPELALLLERLDGSPLLLAASARTDAATARVELARARRIPDLRLDLAYRRVAAVDLDSLDVGLAMSVPVFDSGAARVAQSRGELLAARADERLARLDAERELRAAHLAALQALELARFTDEELVPRAEAWSAAVRVRLELGDVSRAELLRARRAELEARATALEARRELMAAWARLASWLELEADRP